MSEWLVLLLFHESRLDAELLVDFFEVLLACLDEVLLLGPRSVELLRFGESIARSGCYLVSVLEQIHFELVLGLQKILRNASLLMSSLNLSAVLRLAVGLRHLLCLQLLICSMIQRRLVLLAVEQLELVGASVIVAIAVEVDVLLSCKLIWHLHLVHLSLPALIIPTVALVALATLVLQMVAEILTHLNLLSTAPVVALTPAQLRE